MELKEYTTALLRLQNSLYSEIRFNDAVIDIIEINFAHTGDAVQCPPHTHTWFEFNYVTSDSFITSFGQDAQEIGEGMFFIIPPGMEHSHRYNSSRPHRDIVLRWQMFKKDPEGQEGNGAWERLDSLYSAPGRGCTDDGNVGRRLEEMLVHAQNNANPIELQLDFVKFLFGLVKYYSNDKLVQTDGSPGRFDRDIAGKTILKKVEVYLNDANREFYDVHKLAASMHMSYGHLARLYKKYSGETILDRLCSIRLGKSRMLLVQTDYSIKEIAEKLGFSNQYYFSKVFKEKNGISPSQYRKINSGSAH